MATTLQNKYFPAASLLRPRISDAVTVKDAFHALDGNSDTGDDMQFLLKKPNQPVYISIVTSN
jgi:hypothetical protein